jgi:hypothetical protein
MRDRKVCDIPQIQQEPPSPVQPPAHTAGQLISLVHPVQEAAAEGVCRRVDASVGHQQQAGGLGVEDLSIPL